MINMIRNAKQKVRVEYDSLSVNVEWDKSAILFRSLICEQIQKYVGVAYLVFVRLVHVEREVPVFHILEHNRQPGGRHA